MDPASNLVCGGGTPESPDVYHGCFMPHSINIDGDLYHVETFFFLNLENSMIHGQAYLFLALLCYFPSLITFPEVSFENGLFSIKAHMFRSNQSFVFLQKKNKFLEYKGILHKKKVHRLC